MGVKYEISNVLIIMIIAACLSGSPVMSQDVSDQKSQMPTMIPAYIEQRDTFDGPTGSDSSQEYFVTENYKMDLEDATENVVSITEEELSKKQDMSVLNNDWSVKIKKSNMGDDKDGQPKMDESLIQDSTGIIPKASVQLAGVQSLTMNSGLPGLDQNKLLQFIRKQKKGENKKEMKEATKEMTTLKSDYSVPGSDMIAEKKEDDSHEYNHINIFLSPSVKYYADDIPHLSKSYDSNKQDYMITHFPIMNSKLNFKEIEDILNHKIKIDNKPESRNHDNISDNPVTLNLNMISSGPGDIGDIHPYLDSNLVSRNGRTFPQFSSDLLNPPLFYLLQPRLFTPRLGSYAILQNIHDVTS